MDNKYYIAHAGGKIDGFSYTNCKEALLNSISNNYIFIEFDLQEAKDNSLLCMHNRKEFEIITEGTNDTELLSTCNFKSRKIYQKYTPMTLDDVLEIRNKHPFTLITDKIDNPKILNRYFLKNKKGLRIETFSWQRYKALKEDGYLPMMALSKKSILHYIYYCFRCHTRIEWITSSAHSHIDILRLRILKKVFGVKIAFIPHYMSVEKYKQYIGREFDLIYIDDKSILQNSQ